MGASTQEAVGRERAARLAAYNAGPAAVALAGLGLRLPMDVWVARMPYDETREYVAQVFRNALRYALLDGGPTAIPKLELTLPVAQGAGSVGY